MERSSQCLFPSQEKECPPPQLISLKSLPVPKLVSSAVGFSSPPPRSDGREFFKHIKETPVPSEACQEILRLYDFEKAIGEQSSDVLSQLERLMGYKGYPWLNDANRAHVLCYKANRILERYLGSYRFYWLCDTLVEDKPRKIISPKEGATPSPLPEWLSTPYLIRVPSQDVFYKPESLKDPLITGGYSILDSSKKDVGSFSCLMQTTKSRQSSELMWICSTTGHILDDLQTEAFIVRRDTDQQISLQVASRSVRVSGRPRVVVHAMKALIL
ncbi:hypothetical protein PHISCL_01769 [Aspergillus sclerotialis]|uniref:Uncharacterized protein n=1 Tax=Aspergillus sclerotialis TaxID=2070753 RepID=A0A3A2ZX22_9EURO|nr:hypothetical protein PHISCL_01769 [Aspergillus sclerotialis]